MASLKDHDENRLKWMKNLMSISTICIRSGAARAHLSVRRWSEAGSPDRGADGADTTAEPVRAVHRRGGGARRDLSDPSRNPTYFARPDTAWPPPQ
jgi:hypothetical protein